MKSLESYFYVIVLTWKIVNSDSDESDDTAVDFINHVEQADYVDPHSFYYDRVNKKMIDRPTSKFRRSDGICITDGQCREELKQCRDDLNGIEFDKRYTARLINFLLSSAKFSDDGDYLSGSITLSGTREQINELREFGNGKITMRQVDAILSDIVRPTSNIIADTIKWIDYTRIHQYGPISLPVLAAIGTLLLIKFVNWSTGKVVIVFLAAVFLTSYFMIWSELTREAQLKHMVEEMKFKEPPIQCNPEKMSFWQTIVTLFHEDDQCFRYYNAIEANAFHQVTAIDALVETLDKIMLQPFGRIGSVIDSFIDNSTKHLGFGTSWIIKIVLYISVFPIIAMLLICIFGGRIRLWLGPFCGISIGGGHSNQDRQQIPIAQQREPIIYLLPTILERNADCVIQHVASPAIAQSTDHKQLFIGAGDSAIPRQEAKPEDSGAPCTNCCCKNSSRKPHIEEKENPENETTQSEARIEKKGDGDC